MVKIIKKKNTYEWYCACRKLNSSLILSSVSAIVNFIGPCGGGPCNDKAWEQKLIFCIICNNNRKIKNKKLNERRGLCNAMTWHSIKLFSLFLTFAKKNTSKKNWELFYILKGSMYDMKGRWSWGSVRERRPARQIIPSKFHLLHFHAKIA